MGEIGGRGIEDAGRVAYGGLALLIDGGEAAEDDAEGKTQVISLGLGVEFLDVLGKRISFRAIDGFLRPFLGMAPGSRAWMPIFDRQLAMILVNPKRRFESFKYAICRLDLKDWDTGYVAHLKSNTWI
jgi:hypothetical protein